MTHPMVVRFGALGDMVLMTVAIRRLHERFGEPVDVLGSGEWTRPLLEGQPGVGEIYLMGSRHRPYWLAPDQRRLVSELQRRGPGPTWLFDANNERTRWLLERSGWDYRHLVTLDRLADIPGEHFCDRWWRFVHLEPPQSALPREECERADSGPAVRKPCMLPVPRLRVPASSATGLISFLAGSGLEHRRFILIQVGNKRTMRRRPRRRRRSNTKYWPEERWAAVLRGLRKLHPQHALLLLGVRQETALNDQILARAGISGAYNLARDMTVERLMALSERATGMISVDTGPAHVAAALGCPVLTLFDSAEKRLMYAPRGPGEPVVCLTAAKGAPSLLGILPEQVMSAWRGMITAEPGTAALEWAASSAPYSMQRTQ